MIRAAGATPSEAINSMFSTAVTLTMGTPKQKAEMIRDIIDNYSVDVQLLDQSLAGMDIPDDQNVSLMNMLREELAPVHQFMGQMQGIQQNQAQNIQQQVNEELTQFADSNEFYEDVRETMADLLEIAGRRNQQMSLQQAYDQACQMTPDIKKVLDHRAAVIVTGKQQTE